MRPTLALALIIPFTIACGEDDDTSSTKDDTGPDTTDPMAEYIDLTDELAGDISCFEPGGDWLEQSLDEAKVADRTLEGLIEDFEDEIGVNEVDLEIWLSDSFDGAADITAQSNSAGDVTVELPTCTALAYKTSTPPNEERTVDTYELHQVYGYVEEGVPLSDAFNSVSSPACWASAWTTTRASSPAPPTAATASPSRTPRSWWSTPTARSPRAW
jgi:hypothetical protein